MLGSTYKKLESLTKWTSSRQEEATTAKLQDSKMGSHPGHRPDWANLQVLHRNTLPPRSNFLLYSREADALSRDITKAKCHTLSGTWKFHLAKTPFEAPDEFISLGFDSSKWHKIEVPGMWQLQGFGRGPHYTNVQYPFFVDPPHPPYEDNECGSYLTTFELPKELSGHQLRLRFEGVDSAFHVWLNGEEVGYSQGSRNPSEFDVTRLIKSQGPNVLAVRVYQFCDGSYIEDQDQWWLSGIFRDVHLLGFPKDVHFKDLEVRTAFDNKYVDAKLEVTVTLSAPSDVSFKLLDSKQNLVWETKETVDRTDPTRRTVSTVIQQPEHWTAETPCLYTLVLSVNDGQFLSHRVGFRQVEIKDGLLKINNQRVVFKGANRHEHHPKSGRTIPLEFLRHDLYLMKQHNINAIRTSHQPNDPRLYHLADELGFWVVDEADLECHGFEMIADAALPSEQRSLPFAERQKLTRDNAAKWTSDNDDWRGECDPGFIADIHIDQIRGVQYRLLLSTY
jgi:beta-galactosidase